MASILDMRTNNLNPSSFDYWTQEIANFFTPLKYLLTNSRLEVFLKDVDVNYIVNTVFWIFLMFTLGFCGFYHLFHIKEKTKQSNQLAQDIASINQNVSELLDLKKEEQSHTGQHKLHYYEMFANLDRLLNQLPPACVEELGIKYYKQAYEALNNNKVK